MTMLSQERSHIRSTGRITTLRSTVLLNASYMVTELGAWNMGNNASAVIKRMSSQLEAFSSPNLIGELPFSLITYIYTYTG
jgi:hypothetical protein